MGTQLVKMGTLPVEFQEAVKREFVPYSVALGRIIDNKAATFTPIGTGTFIKKSGRFGILTARHCLHECSPKVEIGPGGKHQLMLIFGQGRNILLQSKEIYEHPLVIPESEEYGPDLTFLEIAAGEHLQQLITIVSFWPMDRTSAEVLTEFSNENIMIASIGFPELYCKTAIQGNDIRRLSYHMTFLGAMEGDTVEEKDGWDYILSKCVYCDANSLPESFNGVSGGAIWGMQVHMHSDGHLSIKRSALIGVSFYEMHMENNIAFIRGHFIKSIYELMWKNFVAQ